MRLAYGINRDADQQGRDHARSFVEEKMSSGLGATLKTKPVWPASAASAADWPRLAEAQGGLRRDL